MQKALVFLAVPMLLALVACTQEETLKDRDITRPVLRVTSPTRSLITDAQLVEIKGIVYDETGLSSVMVNGIPVTPDAGGEFSTVVGVEGMTIIETVAVDTSGNVSRDVRGVLEDRFIEGSEIQAAGVAEFSRAGAESLQREMKGLINRTNFSSLLADTKASFGPGKCVFRADLAVESVYYRDSEVLMELRNGGFRLETTLHDVGAEGEIERWITCAKKTFGYTANVETIYVTADFDVIKSTDGSAVVEANNVTVEVNNLTYDSSIEVRFADLFVNFEKAIADGIRDAITNNVADTLQEMLSGLDIAVDLTVIETLFNFNFGLDVLSFTEDRGIATMTSEFLWPEDTKLTYYATKNISTKDDIPALFENMTKPFGLAIHENTLNQLLSTLWHSKVLETQILLLKDKQVSLSDMVDYLEIELGLPPVVYVDKEANALRLRGAEVVVSGHSPLLDEEIMRATAGVDALVRIGLNFQGKPEMVASDIKIIPQVLFTHTDIADTEVAEVLLQIMSDRIEELLIGAVKQLGLPMLKDMRLRDIEQGTNGGYFLVKGDIFWRPWHLDFIEHSYGVDEEGNEIPPVHFEAP